MKATIFAPRKTKKSAERQVADWGKFDPEQNWRVIVHEGMFWTGRDYDPSDAGRSFTVIEVTS